MTKNRTQALRLFGALLVLAAIGALFYYAAWLAALIFILCAAAAAIAVGRCQGIKKGVWLFVKQILFGW
jgi:hypothetical protein